MCLCSVSTGALPEAEVVGWKVLYFYPYNGVLATPYYRKKVKIGRWHKAKGTTLSIYDPYYGVIGSYPAGFHCYATKRSAEKAKHMGWSVVAKVRLRKVVAIGKERVKGQLVKVIVAKEMMIEKIY